MAIFSICIFYSATVPLLSIACVVYAFLRYSVDSLNLITVYRKEIDSQGKLISAVTNTVLFLVIVYQVCMAAFLIVKGKEQEASCCGVILVVSILYIILGGQPIDDFESEAKVEAQAQQLSKEDLEEQIN